MIFCCYDCKIASYESGEDSYVSANFEKYEGSQRAIINFLKAHRYHKVLFGSDAHGQISPEDYLERMEIYE